MPWPAVKKSWGSRRGEWVGRVQSITDCQPLAAMALTLESHLKQETLNPMWALKREAWRGRIESAHTPEVMKHLLPFTM